MSNRGRKNRYNPNDDAPDPRLVIPNLRDQFHAVFKDLDLAEVDLRPILPASAKIVPGQPSCKVLKVVLEAASDDDLTDLFRRLWYLSPKLGKLHQFTSVQLASYFRGVEICNFPSQPMPIARLVKDYISMLPQASTLNLSTADIDLNTELLYSPLPVGIVRIKDMVLLNANTIYASSNHKDLAEILGRPVDSHATPEVFEKYLADIYRSGSLPEYSVRGYFHAKIEEGGQVYTVRDEYDFITNSKRITYADADCYVVDFSGMQLIRKGEVRK
jgi:hypothetical protein